MIFFLIAWCVLWGLILYACKWSARGKGGSHF